MGEVDVWTVRAALDWTRGYLKRKGDENPLLSAQWLLADALGVSRIELYMQFDKPLSPGERDTLRAGVRRRGRGEPLQYITGEVCFRYIPIKIHPGVLIPRPETEVLVSEALTLLSSVPSADLHAHLPSCATESKLVLVADVGTGSGCIACSLAYEHPNLHVIATDISPLAVALARENVCALNLSDRIDVLECDMAEGIDKDMMGKFDLVVSNPPYIPTEILCHMPHEVTDYEPHLALDGGKDGLDIFRRLLTWCVCALRNGGAFAFELHETCLDTAARLAQDAGMSKVRIVRDLAGKPRVLTGRRP